MAPENRHTKTKALQKGLFLLMVVFTFTEFRDIFASPEATLRL